ncbi:hypothetical protein CXB51_029947 [Gossypium anomalum]|uniref:Retrovirus-related Pol polyprotein from transposon TNT 1-94-like beta-barrel domain-containing protein n=2 Tax=Gossypium anomalum TaxID=47600 RepID=A0A8J5Y8C2_9ROSI|nr:hypothetical protein CXB51_029947 [Gossypium anomalum]
MASSSFSPAAPPVFNGEGYHIWVVKMRTYLQAFDLWEVVNSDVEPEPLRANPTVAQMKQYSEEKSKKHKAMSCIQNCVSDVIFTRIMACETPKQAWDKLKEEFQGTERTRQQQLLNLRRDFENLKMKEEETVKKYSDRIMAVVNSIRLLGEQFDEARIVEKVLSTLPERYEAKISSLEDSRDLTSISLTELINALYAQEQMRASRQEKYQEGALQAEAKSASSTSAYEGKNTWSNEPKADGAGRYPPCPHCRRASHPGKVCWFRPDVQCRFCKKMGHVERVCKNKGRPRYNQPQQPRAEAQVVEEDNDQEEQVFAVSYSAIKGKATDGWLIDSGCTNHMTPDASIFKSIDRSFKTNVKVGNGHFIKVEGKGDVLINTPTGTKLVTNVLLVPEIDRNLLSIAQLLEKGYSVVFKGKECLISDSSGSKLMTVAMTEKSFIVDWNKSPDSAYTAAADESKLCHKRFSHANYMSMAQLTKEDSVENFTNSVEKDRKFLTLKEVHDIHGNQSSAQIKELKAHVTSLELELKSLQATNRDMVEQLENKASEAEKLGEQNIRLQSRISELKIMLEMREKEIFILTKKLEDDNSESLSGMKNLTAQENNLLSEKETLQVEKALLKENFAFEGDEASNQVQRLIDEANTLQQQLESLHIQKAKLELQFERKKQKSSEKLNEMENKKSELKQMVEDLQRDFKAKGDEKNDLVNQIIGECLKNKSLQHASQGGVLEIGLHAACEETKVSTCSPCKFKHISYPGKVCARTNTHKLPE